MAAMKLNYDEAQIEAAHQVLLELARMLHEYEEGIVVVGGWVPSLYFDQPQEKHSGTLDVDLALDHNKIQEVGYRSIRELLLNRGYEGSEQPFIFYRTVKIQDKTYRVEVDFLAAEYGGTTRGHRT